MLSKVGSYKQQGMYQFWVPRNKVRSYGLTLLQQTEAGRRGSQNKIQMAHLPGHYLGKIMLVASKKRKFWGRSLLSALAKQ